jgi:hypothetical protein
MNRMLVHKMKVILLLLILSLGIACERRTEVALQGGTVPKFVLTGSGRLGEVVIFGPEQEAIAKTDPFDKTYAVWEIMAEGDGEDGAAPVEGLTITYGVVPRRYKQIKPNRGEAPALTPGKRYSYWFVTVNAPWAAGYFEIRDGKPVSVSGP